MVRFLIFVFLLYLLYRVVRWMIGPSVKTMDKNNQGTIDEMVQDPVCKTYIPLRDAKKRLINGEWYYFCSDKCFEKLEEELKARE